MPSKKQGRKKSLIWIHFIEGPRINSSHHEAECRYCFGKMGGVPANMLKHLKEECSNISEELRNTLHNLDSTNNKTKKNKRSRVEAELNDDNENGIIKFIN